MKCKGIAVLLLVLLLAGTAPSVMAASPAMEQVQQTVDEVIATLKNQALEQEDRRNKLTGLVRARFDFRTMSQWVLATNWRTATEAEKERFVELFSDLLEATYLGRIEAYTDEKVTYVGEQTEGKKAQVDTLVLTAGADIPITYKLVQRGDTWLVYDVVIEEVSLVRNYRSSYNEIVRKEGMNGLFARMEEKIRELRSSKESG